MFTPGHTNSNQTKAIQTEATEAKLTKAARRIEPKISAAFPIIHCALSTELSRSSGNLAQNGAKKTHDVTYGNIDLKSYFVVNSKIDTSKTKLCELHPILLHWHNFLQSIDVFLKVETYMIVCVVRGVVFNLFFLIQKQNDANAQMQAA